VEKLFKKSTLDSGVRLVTEKIPTVRSVAFGVWVQVGGRDETEANQGISHFLEHMIFKGTEKRNKLDIALEIESSGGLVNAMTMKELTCFYAQMLDENIGTAVEVMSDIVANSVFAEEETEKEKTVIIEEINGQEDEPGDLIFDYFFRELYPGHPLGLPILGTKETVNGFKPGDFRNLIREKYTADSIVIAAAGNVEHDALRKMVEDCFKFPAVKKKPGKDKVPAMKPLRKEWKRPISQAHIITGMRSYPYNDQRKYPFLLLNTVLGGGMSSRLFQSVREEFGYAYAIFTFNEALSDTGAWGVYIGTDKDKVEQVLELTYKEYEKVRTELLSAEELQRIKTQLKGNLMLGLESTSSRMNRLAKMEIYLNDFVTLDRVVEEIDKVTAEQVKATAEELLQPEEAVTVVFVP